MKILVSWLAFNNDFSNGQVSKDGPTYQFHKHFYAQDKHIILSNQKSDDIRAEKLASKLKTDFPKHTVEIKYMNVEDVIDLREIKTKVERELLRLQDNEIHIYISPGTPAMQTAWYLIHSTMGLNTSLYQTRKPEHTKDKNKPELIKIEAELSSVPMTAMLRQSSVEDRSVKSDYLISESIKPIYDTAQKIAQTDDVTVLILGESGTGKEHLSKYIHDNSIRSSKPYLTINCSAFSDALLESRLFGYKAGAFTDAKKDTEGLFDSAAGGTIFLDEIGDISPYMQQALLRVLQEKEIMPLGSSQSHKVDVRIIAATNRDLPALCKEGKFRWDLYYRLAVVPLELPSLLERGKKEIKTMINFFIEKKQKQLKKSNKLSFKDEAIEMLAGYSYPGNIRELENIIAGLYVKAEGEINKESLPSRLSGSEESQPLLWAYVEKQHIEKVLRIKKGNQRQAALALGWAINTLRSKMQKYSIS